MAYGQFVDEYRKNAVNGASPLQLVIMLYDGALRFIEAGKRAMLTGDLYSQNQNLQKAQRIVTELTSCLDMEKGGEVAQNLLALYTFVFNQLVEANVEDQIDALEPCLSVLSGLRESWAELEAQQRRISAPAEFGEERLAA